MTGRKIQSAEVSKLMLAVALLLVFSLAFSPFAVAANSDKGKNDGQQDGASDNTQAPEKGHKDDNQVHDEGKDKENHTKDDKHGHENDLPEQPDPQDNDVHDEPDNNVQDQPEEPENSVSDQPGGDQEPPEDNIQEQPSQPDQPNNDFHDQPSRNDPQPASTEGTDQTSVSENQAGLENSVESQPTEVLESRESVEQPAQNNQTAAGITPESGISNVSLSFSESLSILSAGFGIIVAFRLIQVWIQQKYLSQIFALRIQLAGIVSPVYRFLGKVNLMNMRFGKIKCGAGFTKEEALAFFRQCQRLPLTWDRRYG